MLINSSCDYSEKMQRCREYIDALEEERHKIQVFQRELPLCLDLVTQTIEACKQKLSGTTTTTTEFFHGDHQSQCSEQTSSESPALEEFIPIKHREFCSEGEQHSEEQKTDCGGGSDRMKDNKSSDKLLKKSDWLRSVQLWNQTPDPLTNQDSPTTVSFMEVNRNGSGAFHPFKREKNSSAGAPASTGRVATPAAEASSTADNGGKKSEENEGGQSLRKSRRCWSPQLHRRFLQALEQLGGSHVATPKQIRELMKVDGLTNDEVKSHLQKYRLHSRRPGPSIHNNNQPQPPQYVVVGGLWVPPPEYAAVASTTGKTSAAAAATGIYAPVAALPSSLPEASPSLNQRQLQQLEQLQCQKECDERGSHSEGNARSNSPATSSSTHTTTASPSY